MNEGVEFSPQAKRKLAEIWTYHLNKGSTALADRITKEFEEAVDRIASMPSIGHRRPDLTDLDFLFYRVYRYLIIYNPVSTPLRIARIYHGSEDVKSRLLSEPD